MKRKLYVNNGKISGKNSDGAVEVSFYGPVPDYLIRVNLPNGPLYFADKAEAAEFMAPGETHDVSLLPVNLDGAN